MALTEERRASLLAYCKQTEFSDDPETSMLVEVLYEAAVGYLAGAGITEPEAGTPRRAQYDLLINYFVLDKLDKREMTIASTVITENPSFRRLFNQLKLTAGMEPV